ncbi:hypothetical protein C1646_763138 [Rhizophagus diaphanus]|nr:hypothetical protein C1646_763138 [Rhizophagus diaphanus] [Rhizophagus sp. MUCL 43196]
MAAIYNSISTEVITSASIKGRIKRLLEKIFGCRENISPSFISNDSTGYIKLKLSEQRLEFEREKMKNEYKLQTEKLEVEKKKWKYEREKLRLSYELSMKK